MALQETHLQKELLRAKIRREEISAVYHLTWIDNLASIFNLDGLQSKAFLARNRIRRVRTSGNLQSLLTDHAAGNWDKLRLTWRWPHPMFFGMENKHLLCLIAINPEIALSQEAIFTDSNSHDHTHTRKTGWDGLRQVDFDAVRQDFPNTKETKRLMQAEILVPHVPLDFFRRIVFGSEASRKMAQSVSRHYPACQHLFEVDSNFFYGKHKLPARQLQLI